MKDNSLKIKKKSWGEFCKSNFILYSASIWV